MMSITSSEQRISKFFHVSLLLKGAYAFLETISGVGSFFLTPTLIASITAFLTQGELAEDPHDFIATHLRAWTQMISIGSERFIALYLLSHGIIKLWLVISLWRNQRWAYPTSLIIFGFFTIYQAYLLVFNRSLLLVSLTILDIVVMWLIWKEYQIVRKQRAIL